MLATTITAVALFGCASPRPLNLGLQNGRLRPCPETPNCVSSEAGSAVEKLVYPFPAPGGRDDLARLAAIVAAWPRTAVISRGGDYLHAESKSLIWRFTDDVEFRFDSAASVIQVRSASRVGKSDLGVNRKRVEGMRAAWATAIVGLR